MGLTTISNIGNIEKKTEDLEHYIYFLEKRVSILELKIYEIQHPEKVLQLDDSSWDNIRKKKERIKQGSGEKMRKPGSPGAPTAANFKRSAKTAKKKK